MGIILTGDIGEATRGNNHDASFLGCIRIYERKYLVERFSNTGNRYPRNNAQSSLPSRLDIIILPSGPSIH